MRNSAFRDTIKNYFQKTDFLLLTIALACSGIGLVLISSVGSKRELLVQSIAICLGVIAYLFISAIDLDQISSIWKLVIVANLLLLSLTLFFGTGKAETGNNSWIRINIGSTQIGFQPAELGKILYIFILAKHIDVLGDKIRTFKGFCLLALNAIIPVVFVLFFSEDDGMATSYIFIFVIMAFAAGIRLGYCFGALGLFAAAVPILWFFVFSRYQKDRFLVLFNSNYNPNVAYHQLQALAAIRSGGFWGDGYKCGSICQKGYLPADHTDFIFCVACEEFGFFGGFVILVLLSLLIIVCVISALKLRESKFSMLICLGVAAMFTYQMLLNVGMCLKVAPVIGLTLPFISYGGTSVLTMFIAIAMVSSVKAHYVKRLSISL